MKFRMQGDFLNQIELGGQAFGQGPAGAVPNNPERPADRGRGERPQGLERGLSEFAAIFRQAL
jgi:hypothetical protein